MDQFFHTTISVTSLCLSVTYDDELLGSLKLHSHTFNYCCRPIFGVQSPDFGSESDVAKCRYSIAHAIKKAEKNANRGFSIASAWKKRA